MPRQLDTKGYLVRSKYENLHNSDLTLSACPNILQQADLIRRGLEKVGVSTHVYYLNFDYTENPKHIVITATVDGKNETSKDYTFINFIGKTIKIGFQSDETTVALYDRDTSGITLAA